MHFFLVYCVVLNIYIARRCCCGTIFSREDMLLSLGVLRVSQINVFRCMKCVGGSTSLRFLPPLAYQLCDKHNRILDLSSYQKYENR